MRSLYFLLVLIVGSHQSSIENVTNSDLSWDNFKKIYNKTYLSIEDENRRIKIFAENKIKVDEHNEKFKTGHISYEMGINHFSDMTLSEILQLNQKSALSLKSENIPGKTHLKVKPSEFRISENVSVPIDFDWREKGAVTPVGWQKGCGSCYAFGAVGAIEGAYFRKTGKLVELSKQQLVNCFRHGCKGGMVEEVFEYVFNNGIDTEEHRPYTSREKPCSYTNQDAFTYINGYVEIPSGNEELLKRAVALVGPVATSVNLVDRLRAYRKGVFVEYDCPNLIWNLSHVVLIVGYGHDGGLEYWIVKNSWGPAWGENGYFRIIRNYGNNCGIATSAFYPFI